MKKSDMEIKTRILEIHFLVTLSIGEGICILRPIPITYPLSSDIFLPFTAEFLLVHISSLNFSFIHPIALQIEIKIGHLNVKFESAELNRKFGLF